MEAKGKVVEQKDLQEAYVSEINWDWLFFKAQIVFSIILILGLVGFFVWMW